MVKLNPFVVFLFALYLVVPFVYASFKSVQYCNKNANYPVKVSGLDISPYPIVRGKNTTFAISASTDEAITGGKMNIDVTYFFFHVYTEEKDLCIETACPIPAGDFLVSHSQELPGITPPGNYNLKMTMLDAKKKQLTCITFDFSIGFLAAESETENFASI